MSTYDIDVEIAAMQAVIFALISSHPDKGKLLSTFDKQLSENQIAALACGGAGISQSFRESLMKYRALIEKT